MTMHMPSREAAGKARDPAFWAKLVSVCVFLLFIHHPASARRFVFTREERIYGDRTTTDRGSNGVGRNERQSVAEKMEGMSSVGRRKRTIPQKKKKKQKNNMEGKKRKGYMDEGRDRDDPSSSGVDKTHRRKSGPTART
jgi:hypothetical protein